jgi:hypothetical protein
VLENLSKIPKRSAAGVDGQTVEAAKESFEGWIEPVLQSIQFPRQEDKQQIEPMLERIGTLRR